MAMLTSVEVDVASLKAAACEERNQAISGVSINDNVAVTIRRNGSLLARQTTPVMA